MSVTSRYSWQSASNPASLATISRTFSSSSGNCASSDRIRSTMAAVPILTKSAIVPLCCFRCFSSSETGADELDLCLPDFFDDVGIGQRRDIAGILVVRDGRQDAAHELARTRLRHVRHDHDVAGASNRPDLPDHGVLYSFAQLLAWLVPWFQRHVEIGGPAFDFVFRRYHCRFGDLLHEQAGRLDLLGPEPVPGDVDDVVDPAQDAIVAVSRLQGTVIGEIGPVPPVLAVRVLAIPPVVCLDEAIRVLPDRLEYSGPRVLDADVPRAPRAWRNLVALLVVDDWMDAGHARTRAARFHRVKRRHRAAEEPTVFGLPPGVDNGGLTLADNVVIPPPDCRLDRLAHRRHMLEAIVVFCRLIGSGTSQGPDCRGRGVEDVDVEFLGDAPRTASIGMGGNPFVDHRGGGEGQRPVDNVRMTRDPADIGHAPVDVLGMNVLNVFRRPGDVSEIPAGAVLTALRLPGGAARVHQEQGGFGRHLHRIDPAVAEERQHLIDDEIAALDQRRLARIALRVADRKST